MSLEEEEQMEKIGAYVIELQLTKIEKKFEQCGKIDETLKDEKRRVCNFTSHSNY